ncbi:uncharacterized protein VP01_297g1 [Puccinia sorghi]|uniref:Uncharacterized protein n=1 Tax=Puccinia sorghi TaxID=27349 RepID=A0A0L6V1D7_9BASI|nr:uncharacterized protein VP01_297g1 [Puccinia sorghi]
MVKANPKPASPTITTPKQNPNQMQTIDYPKTFPTVKASFFVHIKSLWGLLYQDLVPSSTPMNLLTDFYAYFNNVSQLESVSKAQSPDLVPCQDITIGADSQPGKVAKSIGHLIPIWMKTQIIYTEKPAGSVPFPLSNNPNSTIMSASSECSIILFSHEQPLQTRIKGSWKEQVGHHNKNYTEKSVRGCDMLGCDRVVSGG